MHTVNAMRALGIKIEQPQPDTLIVHGKKRVLAPPKKEIDCEILARQCDFSLGLLAGQTFESRLVGDAALSRRPMDQRDRAALPDGCKYSRRGAGTDATASHSWRLLAWNSLSAAHRELPG